MLEQLNLFDLPQQPVIQPISAPKTVKEVEQTKTQERERLRTEANEYCPYVIPTVEEILKLIDRQSGSTYRAAFISDIFACGAIAISNRFDKANFDEREKNYLDIIKKYNEKDQRLIAEILAKIIALLTSVSYKDGKFDDYLGRLYMLSETSNSKAGQFFTPYSVSKLMAEVTLSQDPIESKLDKNGVLTLLEPTCGSGGMILATCDTLLNKYNFNYSRNLFVECGDIDERCVHMAYLQLTFAGVPAVIKHQDALSQQYYRTGIWRTPPYLMQWLRFRKYENLN